jgi:hypothetical protein
VFDEQASNDIAKVGLELLCDVEVFLGLVLSSCWNLLRACPNLLRIRTFLYAIMLLMSRNVKCNCIKCIVINKPCMEKRS